MGGDSSGIEPRRRAQLLTLADFVPGVLGDRQDLARLSNPSGGSVTWTAGEYIGLAGATTNSFADPYDLEPYVPEAVLETLDRFTVSLGAATGVNCQITLYKIDVAGVLTSLGLNLNVGGSGTFFQSIGDPRTLAAGERLVFTIDQTISVPWVAICGFRSQA